ncbi:LacI family transcriptional regulator (plasmid) [Neorhizobium sp. NCHU2750]|nr:LacI family transcriptional regulator [Neorhizobium sp. NCHU2750]
MVTIRDVAKAAGVAVSTVSAVVNNSAYVSPELRERVEAAVRSLRYAPSRTARNLKSGRSQLIALSVSNLKNPFFAEIVLNAEALAADWGYSLVVLNSGENPEREKRNVMIARELSCDGMIISPVGRSDPSRWQALEGKIPLVLLAGPSESNVHDTVTLNNVSAGRQVTDYLLDMQHTRIGSVTGTTDVDPGRGRYQGMLDAMSARGVDVDTSLVRSGAFREDTAYSAARELLQLPRRPTAIYVANGIMALGVLRAISDLGLECPRDISIVSTDVVAGLPGVRPRLTRTVHPVAKMTTEAVRMLVDRLNGHAEAPPRHAVFEPDFVIGDSCKPFVGY